jgi:hypothetical protein
MLAVGRYGFPPDGDRRFLSYESLLLPVNENGPSGTLAAKQGF